MSLLTEIQLALMDGDKDIGRIFLKLKYLAAKLESNPLEEWVKYESEGYPKGTIVPDYRRLSISYNGSFSGPFGSAINKAPLPTALIAHFAGDHWLNYEMRQSIAAIDNLIDKNDHSFIHVDMSNLIMIIQGKIYEDYACNSVSGIISNASLSEIQHVVRSRILEFTLKLENEVPLSKEIAVNKDAVAITMNKSEKQTITQITNQVVHGNLTKISNHGDNADISVQVNARDNDSFEAALLEVGLPKKDVEEISKIISSELPDQNSNQPWGEKAKVWLSENLPKAVNGTWKVGMDVAGKVLTEAAKKYYGLD